jgi:hypothetical protein
VVRLSRDMSYRWPPQLSPYAFAPELVPPPYQNRTLPGQRLFPVSWHCLSPAAEQARAAVGEGFCPFSVLDGTPHPLNAEHACLPGCGAHWDLIPGGFRVTWHWGDTALTEETRPWA